MSARLPVRLSPSVMCVGAGREKTVAGLEALGMDLVHADVMDGVFVPNFMLGTDDIAMLHDLTPLPLDIHLMIERPEERVRWFGIRPGDTVSVHVESTRHIGRAFDIIRSLGASPCAALNPATPLCALDGIIGEVDMILVMTVNPGFAGQKLIPYTVEKIAELRQKLDDKGYENVRIEADGNVSFGNIPKLSAAGADTLVLGTSSLFSKDAPIEQNAKRVRELAG